MKGDPRQGNLVHGPGIQGIPGDSHQDLPDRKELFLGSVRVPEVKVLDLHGPSEEVHVGLSHAEAPFENLGKDLAHDGPPRAGGPKDQPGPKQEDQEGEEEDEKRLPDFHGWRGSILFWRATRLTLLPIPQRIS